MNTLLFVVGVWISCYFPHIHKTKVRNTITLILGKTDSTEHLMNEKNS